MCFQYGQAGFLKYRLKFGRGDEPVPVVGSVRQPVQHIFGADHRQRGGDIGQIGDTHADEVGGDETTEDQESDRDGQPAQR